MRRGPRERPLWRRRGDRSGSGPATRSNPASVRSGRRGDACRRRRGHFGRSGYWVLPVVATAIVWAAVTGNVGLGDCCFQRHRTGPFARVHTSGLRLRTGHTEHRYSGSQSRGRSTRRLHSEGYRVCRGCALPLDARACGVTRGGTTLHGFFSFACRRGTSRQVHDALAFSKDSRDQNIPNRPVYPA